jgi:hypothetical protein
MTRHTKHRARRTPLLRTALLLTLLAARPVAAVVLDDENRLTVTLKEGTTVALIGEASQPGVKSRTYYYLPTNVRVGTKPDGTPEFLFMKFTSDRRADQGGVTGALLHFMMTWGLTEEQETELKAKLKALFPTGTVAGQVQLETPSDATSFQVISATLSDSGLAKSVLLSGKAPLVAGGRASAAARLTAEGAALLGATFDKTRSIADLSVALTYGYTTLMPAARGSIVIDWSKLEQQSETLRAEYTKKQTGTTHSQSCLFIFCASSSTPEYSYTYDEVRRQYKFLEEKQIVTLQFDELIADERVAKIRDAFFQFFLNSMARPADPQGPPPEPSQAEKDKSPDVRVGQSYKFSQSAFKQSMARKVQRFDLNYRTSVKWPVQIVGNLASWYDAAKSNPKCVSTVNVDDPFFEKRDVSFILDLDAKEIFGEVLNYVTVNVRKARTPGPDFTKSVTIDADYLAKKGVTATLTYARGEDQNSDLYEYQAQWSVKGGQQWPADPPWMRGAWEGVTLTPPLVPRLIEAEADLERMKASGITRATVQIRYPRFGAEAEENVQLSPAKNEPLVSRRIFVDRGSKGYVYRVILNHQSQGKLVLPWSPQLGDDYVYVTIPPDLLSDGPLLTAAKEAGRVLATTATEKVLDKFKDVLGGSR